MKKLILAAVIVMGFAPAAMADDWEDRADYTRRLEQEQGLLGPSIFGGESNVETVHVRADRAKVAQDLARATEQQMGHRWVPTAIKIAEVESGLNCGAVGPRLRGGDHALGIGQVRIGSARALGYAGSAGAMRSCATGIKLMLAHMKRCEQEGATSEALMARCHVAGWASLRRRLSRSAERYARSYQYAVMAKRVRFAMR